MASENLKRVLGVYDPQVKTDGNKSGKAIRAEQSQSEQSNYHLYDNLTRSIKHTWRIILDWTPRVYDTERVMRIIGDDGKPDLVTVNEKGDKDGVQTVLNDVTVGLYDVVMDTGPGYNTKRQEGFDAMTQLMAGPLGEEIAKVGGDLVVRLLDVSGIDVLADRLAAANPLAQIDEKSDVPPQAQMQIQKLTQQLKQAGQAIDAMQAEIKYKNNAIATKEAGETHRLILKEDAEGRRTKETLATKRHDTESRALSSQNVAEIKGLVELLRHKLDAHEAVNEFDRNMQMQDKQLEAKSDQSETV